MKTYVKPELFFESFELSQHIAGCSLQLNVGDAATCNATGCIEDIYEEGKGTGVKSGWFIDSQICAVEVEAYCYTNGSMNIATINS